MTETETEEALYEARMDGALVVLHGLLRAADVLERAGCNVSAPEAMRIFAEGTAAEVGISLDGMAAEIARAALAVRP